MYYDAQQEIIILKNLLKREQEKNRKLQVEMTELKNNREQTSNLGKKGRPRLSEQQVEEVRVLGELGYSVRKIEKETGVSVGSISNVLKEFRKQKRTVREIEFLFQEELCTRIYVDFQNETVEIENFTEDNIRRAFGCKKQVSWQDFQGFLEERCFPRSRDRMKYVLKDFGISAYDPWQIIQVTQGRMAEDKQWIRVR